jgi:mRNA interferase MazF
MTAKKYEIWLANLDPRFGTEAGKTRPVLIVQTDSLNKVHPSTLICPITTNIKPESQILPVDPAEAARYQQAKETALHR